MARFLEREKWRDFAGKERQIDIEVIDLGILRTLSAYSH